MRFLRSHAGSILYSQAVITGAVMIANFSNIIFVFLALQLPAYQLAEVLSILSILSVLTILQSSSRNDVILLANETAIGPAVKRSVSTQGFISFVVFLILLAAAPLFSAFLHFPDALPFQILSIGTFTFSWNGIIQGMLAADKKIGRHALALIFETVCRLPFAYVIFNDGYVSTDTSLIILGSNTVALLLNALLLSKDRRRMLLPDIRGIHWPDIRTSCVLMTSGLCLGASMKMDILWAKHILDGEQAGIYGMMSFIAGILFLNTSGISRAAISFIKEKDGDSMIMRSYAVILSLCVASVAVFYAVGMPFLSLITDKGDRIAHGTLLVLFGAFSFYSLMHFSVQCLSVLHRNIHMRYSLILVAVQGAGLVLFAKTEMSLAVVNALVMCAFSILFMRTLHSFKNKGDAIRQTSHPVHGHHSSI